MVYSFNRILLALTLICAVSFCRAQNNEWVWMGGAPDSVPWGAYGSLGVANTSNHPGARYAAMTWTDESGGLWLFGGFGYDSGSTSIAADQGYLNDLWKFNTSTGEWAWMGGSETIPCTTQGNERICTGQSGTYGTSGQPAAANVPGARFGAAVWTDQKGDFWLFGGSGFDSAGNNGTLNDLWRFDPSSSNWTWFAGASTVPSCAAGKDCGASGSYGAIGNPSSSNSPGARTGAVTWTDSSGNLWLFGGSGYDSAGNVGDLNDLWEFNPSTSEWTWMGGSSTVPGSCFPFTICGNPGVYGSLGTPSSANIPGGRSGAVGWTDKSGNFWLFGGEANYWYAEGYHGDMNDLWEFSPSTREWTWMGGANSPLVSCNGLTLCSPTGVYGAWQTPASGDQPGARESSVSWVDANGDFWLFGGDGVDAAGNYGRLNDLWEFNPTTNQWAWMSGDTIFQQYSSAGSQGMASLSASPGSRDSAVGWTDQSGNLWLLGGIGSSFMPYEGAPLGDLWKYMPNAPEGEPATDAPVFSPTGGTYTSVQSVSLTSSTPNAAIYYRINGSTPTLYSQPIAVTQSETITAVAAAPNSATSDATTAAYTLNLPPPPAPSFSPPPGTYYGIQSVAISDAESFATIYYTTDGTTPTANSKVYSGSFAVSSSETVQAIAVVSGNGTSGVAGGAYTILPVPPNTWTWMRGDPSGFNASGNYGELALPLAQNQPGARVGSVGWTDNSGNLWLFGGYGYDSAGNPGDLNDLWEYLAADGVWVWMGGSSALACSTNLGVTSCKPAAGVYGTLGQPSAASYPGGRESSVSWVDSSGNLWLFGGLGADSSGGVGTLNDVWRFTPSTGQWTWMGGNSQSGPWGQPGVYGSLGMAASSNVPGSRYGSVAWTDSAGNFWLFGGYGDDAKGNIWELNDLLRFNPASNQWTWMGGTSTLNCVVQNDSTLECAPVPGQYGTKGSPSSANVPGARYGAAGWTDSNGNLWLFGGTGYDSAGNEGNPNDLWKYDPSANQWTWESGSDTVPCGYSLQYNDTACTNSPEVRGALGVPAAGNTPSGSASVANWVDKQGNLWLFGTGSNMDITGSFQGPSSDLWVYSTALNQWTWMGGDFATSNCEWIDAYTTEEGPYYECQGAQGRSGFESQPGVGNIPPSRYGAQSWTDHQGNLWLFGGQANVISVSLLNQFYKSDLWEFQPAANTIPPAAAPIFSLAGGSYASGGPLAMSNGMANASIYFTTDGSVPTPNSTLYTGPITLSSSEKLQAIAVAPGYIPSGVASADYYFIPTPPAPVINPQAGTYNSSQTITISDSGMAPIYYSFDGVAASPPSGAPYYAPFTISKSTTVNAVGAIYGNTVDNGIANFADSPVVGPESSATYTINLPPAPMPTFSVPAGTYTSAQTVTISDSINGATIYYTTDGSTPTTSSWLYLGPITVPSTETINAIAIATASGYSASGVASATYTINLAPPGFTGGSGGTTSITVTAGSTSGNTGTISVAGTNGFTGSVNLTCAVSTSIPNANDMPICSLNPASVTISGSAAQTSTLTITTTAATSAARGERNLFSREGGGAVFALIVLFGGYKRRRRWQTMLGLLLFALCVGLVACGGGGAGSSGGGGSGGGGGGGNPGTTPGAYTVKVTGTSGTLSATVATVSVTVQ